MCNRLQLEAHMRQQQLRVRSCNHAPCVWGGRGYTGNQCCGMWIRISIPNTDPDLHTHVNIE